MLTRNQIKYIQSLGRKSVRAQEQKFVIEGVKLCEEVLSSGFRVDMLYMLEGMEVSIDANVSITRISEKDLSRISQLKTPNKMLAVVHMPVMADVNVSLNGKVILLDHINDPGNLGTIIRMADWFNMAAVYCTKNSVDVFNAKVIQSSMGSVFRVPVMYVDGPAFLTQYQSTYPNHTIWSAEMQGTPLNQVDFSGNGILIMGSESHGVHADLQPFITEKLTIPAIGHAESLNVATATSMVLWEIFR